MLIPGNVAGKGLIEQAIKRTALEAEDPQKIWNLNHWQMSEMHVDGSDTLKEDAARRLAVMRRLNEERGEQP